MWGNIIIQYPFITLTYKMKIFNWAFELFEFKKISYFISNINRKRLIEREYSRDKYVISGVTGLFLRHWSSDNQTLDDIMKGIFINVICTTEYNNNLEWRKKRFISSTLKNIFYAIPADAKNDEFVIKNIFQTVSISRENTIERPIMMELMFWCLTWKQWLL